MELECTGTSQNDTEIYWNEHEYGRLNLKRAKCDVLAFRFFLFSMGAGEEFHILSVNNFVSL